MNIQLLSFFQGERQALCKKGKCLLKKQRIKQFISLHSMYTSKHTLPF